MYFGTMPILEKNNKYFILIMMKLKLSVEQQRCCFAALKRHLEAESGITSTTNIFHPLLNRSTISFYL